MPDSIGKRKRRDVTARKHAAREERRVARAGRKKDREAGPIEPGPPIGPADRASSSSSNPKPTASADAQSSRRPSPPSPRLGRSPRTGTDARSEAEEEVARRTRQSCEGGKRRTRRRAGSSLRSERT